jgi:transcription initiation factor TFIID subunit TAF12
MHASPLAHEREVLQGLKRRAESATNDLMSGRWHRSTHWPALRHLQQQQQQQRQQQQQWLLLVGAPSDYATVLNMWLQ